MSKAEYMTKWRAANKERLAAYNRAYADANAEAIRARRSARHAGNAEVYRKQSSAWKAANTEAVREYNRIYTATRRKTDPIFRLKMTERVRIVDGLKGAKRAGTSTHLLGCSWQRFYEYIEAKFTIGMTWQNMGEWHVDHIRPLASFDLADHAQQCVAFHYSNHQPLWAIDNLKKGARFEVAHA